MDNTKVKSPKFYKYYPRLFHKYFKGINGSFITDLSNAGYLYYQATLFMDSLIDNKDFTKLPLIITYQEETIKILTSIYGKDSKFWISWNKRKSEYFEAIILEKKLQLQNEIDFVVYKDLADKKAAFGKIAIDCLFFLSIQKENKRYEALLESHAYFSLGFQLYDDVKDFKEDFENSQFNWAIYKLKEKINFSQYNNDIQILNKLVFIEGIAQEILLESINSFKKAINIVNQLKEDSEWKIVIQDMKETIVNYLDITNGYLATITAKIELKNGSTTI